MLFEGVVPTLGMHGTGHCLLPALPRSLRAKLVDQTPEYSTSMALAVSSSNHEGAPVAAAS